MKYAIYKVVCCHAFDHSKVGVVSGYGNFSDINICYKFLDELKGVYAVRSCSCDVEVREAE